MNKKSFLILLLSVGLLASAFAPVLAESAKPDLDAVFGKEIPDNQIDGGFGTEWDDAAKYSGVAINPQGTADVWTKNDGTYLYLAVRFTADSDNPWVAVQLGGNSCMEANTDAALLGNDNYNRDGYVDGYLSGTGGAKADPHQDGLGGIGVSPSNVVSIELKKPLDSGDVDGKDINWTTNETYSLVLIWDSNGRGSSGGTTSHSGGFILGTALVRTIMINTENAPENQGPNTIDVNLVVAIVALAAAIVAILLVAVFLIRRRIRTR